MEEDEEHELRGRKRLNRYVSYAVSAGYRVHSKMYDLSSPAFLSLRH